MKLVKVLQVYIIFSLCAITFFPTFQGYNGLRILAQVIGGLYSDCIVFPTVYSRHICMKIYIVSDCR